MTTLINDPDVEARVLEERRASGGDRFDEVWDGVYVMSPMANNEHQRIAGGLNAVYQIVIAWEGLGEALPGANVSDREEDWKENYRVPDAAVFLFSGKARNLGTHWVGGPDHAVEIISPGDRSRDKIPFYDTGATKELLIIDCDPWGIELYQRKRTKLVLVGRCTLAKPIVLESKVLPLTYTLAPGRPRPKIIVTHRETGQEWRV